MKTSIKLGTLSNGPDTILPVWKIEDRLVSWALRKGDLALPFLIELTAQAFHRYDAACREYVQRAVAPYAWHIIEGERYILYTLLQKYPVGGGVSDTAEKVLKELLQVATIDEVATGAFNALRWIAHRTGDGI